MTDSLTRVSATASRTRVRERWCAGAEGAAELQEAYAAAGVSPQRACRVPPRIAEQEDEAAPTTGVETATSTSSESQSTAESLTLVSPFDTDAGAAQLKNVAERVRAMCCACESSLCAMEGPSDVGMRLRSA